MELDKDRLAKLLRLTESEHDGEALAAIRKANDLLRQHRTSWAQALGAADEVAEPTPADEPRPERPQAAAAEPTSRPAAPPPPPPGYLRAKTYRAAFLREPLLPRLLGFPFWIMLEVLALLAPDRLINVRGTWLTAAFTFSMMLGIVAWIALAYALLIGSG